MAYVRVVSPAEAEGELRRAYDLVQAHRGGIANVFRVQSLRPDALMAHLGLYMAVMFGPSGLSRREREALAMVVSAANNCSYCVVHHAAALRHHEPDGRVVDRLGKGEIPDDLPPRLRAILAYGRKLTKASFAIDDADIQTLRKAGLDDETILSTNLVAAYYNLVNRLVDGLGVDLDDPGGYQY